jgi:hypothetical protein
MDDEPPFPAFEAAEPPYSELARLYSGYAGSWHVCREDGIILVGYSREQAGEKLIAGAESDALAFDAALWLVADAIRYGSELPKCLREWAFYALTGRIKRPKMKGKYPPALAWRDATIVSLCRDLCRNYGLKATSSHEDGGESACAALAEALRLMRLQLDSYASIRRIWLRRNKKSGLPEYLL